MAYWIPLESRNIHLPLFFDDKRCNEYDKSEHFLSARMARWIPPGLKNIHIPLFFDENRCRTGPVLTNNMIGWIPPELKNIHIPFFFNENRYVDDDNRNGNALMRNLKAKRDRITQIFRLPRPAAQEIKIAVLVNSVEDANMTKKEKKKKKKMEKQKRKKTKKDKNMRKVEPTQSNAEAKEENKRIPNSNDEITVIETADDTKKRWKILSCFGYISSWVSRKKQQRKEKKKRNRRVRFSESVSVKIYEPASTYENKCGLDARHVGEVGIHVF